MGTGMRRAFVYSIRDGFLLVYDFLACLLASFIFDDSVMK
jgi:hypothetical protein